jgi:hypothetical protein
VSVITSLRINSISVQGDGTVRIDGMSSQFKAPVATGSGSDTSYNYIDLGIQTDLDIKEGQKVVVGRVGMSHDQALFLVMVARVL